MLGYTYMHDMGWGWAILMTIGWIALLGLVAAVAVAAVRDRRNPSAREILDKRLAAGEIDLEEYERARDAMTRDSDQQTPPRPPATASQV